MYFVVDMSDDLDGHVKMLLNSIYEAGNMDNTTGCRMSSTYGTTDNIAVH